MVFSWLRLVSTATLISFLFQFAPIISVSAKATPHHSLQLGIASPQRLQQTLSKTLTDYKLALKHLKKSSALQLRRQIHFVLYILKSPEKVKKLNLQPSIYRTHATHTLRNIPILTGTPQSIQSNLNTLIFYSFRNSN